MTTNINKQKRYPVGGLNTQRCITFRVWDIVKREMVLGTFSIIGEVTMFDLLKQYSFNQLNDIVVMQFTGLQDKTGKDIYEGDIVSFIEGEQNEISNVFFESGCFSVFAKNNDPFYKPCLGIIDKDNLKIIGSIFENPELIENVLS